jgi:ribosomal protein L9
MEEKLSTGLNECAVLDTSLRKLRQSAGEVSLREHNLPEALRSVGIKKVQFSLHSLISV